MEGKRTDEMTSRGSAPSGPAVFCTLSSDDLPPASELQPPDRWLPYALCLLLFRCLGPYALSLVTGPLATDS
jgi:hypothetical protein